MAAIRCRNVSCQELPREHNDMPPCSQSACGTDEAGQAGSTGGTRALATTFFTSMINSLKKSFKDTRKFLGEMSKDQFKWQILKSVLFFMVGLKLFDDIARDFADELHHHHRF